jgi:hypothetical protein
MYRSPTKKHKMPLKAREKNLGHVAHSGSIENPKSKASKNE